MAVDFSGVYRSKSDSELLRLSKEKDSLQPSARIAFDAEMHRRGLQEGDAHRREIEVNEEADRVESAHTAKIQARDNWFLKILKCAVVFIPAALLTVVIAERIFKLSNPVIYVLTLASMKAAFGVSVLASLIGSRWLTFKRLLIAGVIFSIGLFGFVVWLTRSH